MSEFLSKRLSRRDLLRSSILGAAAIAASACVPSDQARFQNYWTDIRTGDKVLVIPGEVRIGKTVNRRRYPRIPSERPTFSDVDAYYSNVAYSLRDDEYEVVTNPLVTREDQKTLVYYPENSGEVVSVFITNETTRYMSAVIGGQTLGMSQLFDITERVLGRDRFIAMNWKPDVLQEAEITEVGAEQVGGFANFILRSTRPTLNAKVFGVDQRLAFAATKKDSSKPIATLPVPTATSRTLQR